MDNSFEYGLGYELEAYKMNLLQVKALMKDAELHSKKSGKVLDYTKYNILDESDITKIDDTLQGGEIVSPIIYNQQDLEESICYVLNILKKAKACNLDSNHSHAGLHFHFGLESLYNDYQNYYRLIKFMYAFSGEVFAHSHNQNEGLRISVHQYANPYPKQILDYLFTTYQDFKFLDANSLDIKYKNPLICFSSKGHMYRFTEQTIEFRTCNTPLIPAKDDTFNILESYYQFILYVSLYQKIIQYITSKDFDMELINHYYKLERNNPFLYEKDRLEVFNRLLKLE